MNLSLFISIFILITLLFVLGYIVSCYYYEINQLHYIIEKNREQDLLLNSINTVETNIQEWKTINNNRMNSHIDKLRIKKSITNHIGLIHDVINDIVLHTQHKTKKDIDQWKLIQNVCLEMYNECNQTGKEERFSLAQIEKDWTRIANSSNSMISNIENRINWLKNALSNVNWNAVGKRLKDIADEAAKRAKEISDAAAKRAKDIAKKANPIHWGGCFSRNTKVTLSDGTVKRIVDVAQGDILLGWGGTFNRAISVETFEMEPNTTLWGFNNETPFFSDGHVFMTHHGWKSISPKQTELEVPGFKVGKLQVGDIVFKMNTQINSSLCSYVPIRIHALNKQKIGNDTILYNVDIEGNHSYHANDFVVHSMFKTEESDKIEQKKIESLQLNEKKRLSEFIIKEFSVLSKIYGSTGIYQLAKALGIPKTKLHI